MSETGTTTFTTWAALYAQMLDEIASGKISVVRVSPSSGKSIEYATLAELRAQLDYVRTMAALEAGTVSLRIYAGQAGRCGS